MGESNFWAYTLFIIAIVHLLGAFGYIIYKMNKKKETK
jgi:nitrate reductase NapE component